jgi:hypothetical protein
VLGEGETRQFEIGLNRAVDVLDCVVQPEKGSHVTNLERRAEVTVRVVANAGFGTEEIVEAFQDSFCFLDVVTRRSKNATPQSESERHVVVDWIRLTVFFGQAGRWVGVVQLGELEKFVGRARNATTMEFVEEMLVAEREIQANVVEKLRVENRSGVIRLPVSKCRSCCWDAAQWQDVDGDY